MLGWLTQKKFCRRSLHAASVSIDIPTLCAEIRLLRISSVLSMGTTASGVMKNGGSTTTICSPRQRLSVSPLSRSSRNCTGWPGMLRRRSVPRCWRRSMRPNPSGTSTFFRILALSWWEKHRKRSCRSSTFTKRSKSKFCARNGAYG